MFSVKKVFASILFGFIALVFVFVGLDPSQFGGGGGDTGGAAAVVADRMISLQQFQQAFEMRQQQFESQLSQLPAAQRQAQTQRIRDEVLEQLIQAEMQSVLAENLGLVASDDEVRSYILNIPYLQKDGQFDRSRYDGLVQYLRTTPADFEESLRKEIKARKLSELFNQAFKKVDGAVDPKAQLAAIEASMRFFKLDEESLRSFITVPSTQASAWASDAANAEALKAEYDKRQLDFMDRERAKTRQIILSSSEKRERASELKELLTPENFATLAAQWSDDKGSAQKGGDIGFPSRGTLDPTVEAAFFDGPVKKVQGPFDIREQTYFFLIEEKRPAGVKPLADVKSEIAAIILENRKIEELRTRVKEVISEGGSVAQLEAAVRASGGSLRSAGNFKLDAPEVEGLGSATALVSSMTQKPEVGRVHPELLRVEGVEVAVVFDKWKQNPVNPKAAADNPFANIFGDMDFETMAAANETFRNWMEPRTEKIRVVKNSRVLLL